MRAEQILKCSQSEIYVQFGINEIVSSFEFF